VGEVGVVDEAIGVETAGMEVGDTIVQDGEVTTGTGVITAEHFIRGMHIIPTIHTIHILTQLYQKLFSSLKLFNKMSI
jgi:hypothetical protein